MSRLRWPPLTGRGGRLAVAALVVLAFALRAYEHARTFDVFVDEFFYADLGHSVRAGGFPRSGTSDIFFLHPPGFLYLEGLWQDLVGSGRGALQEVFRLRLLNSVLGALTAGLIALIVGRRSTAWGLLLGALFAVEPFALRQNGRVLLETAVMMWALLGLLLVLPLLTQSQSQSQSQSQPQSQSQSQSQRRRDRLRMALAGLCLGMAVFTKDPAVLVTILPMFAAGFLLGRRHLRWVLPTFAWSLLPYGLFVLLVVLNGHLAGLWTQKLSGLSRASGADVTTGFARGGEGPSLTSALRAQVPDFGATYLLLAIGVVALVVVLRLGDTEARYVALVHGGAGLIVGYSLLFGTIEEQFLYLLVVTTMLVIGLAAALLQSRARPVAGRQPTGRPDRVGASS